MFVGMCRMLGLEPPALYWLNTPHVFIFPAPHMIIKIIDGTAPNVILFNLLSLTY